MIKIAKYSFVCLIIFCGLITPVLADQIDKYDTVVKIKEDSSLDVTETIAYDFGVDKKHGIYRDIPIKYYGKVGTYSLDIGNISVKDEKGHPAIFQEIWYENNKRLKIGDPSKIITGKKIYIISYNTKGALNYFSDHDELYWNITGNSWQIPIKNISAEIILPQPIGKDAVKTDCFSDYKGSSAKCENINFEIENDLVKGVKFSELSLNPEQGLTVVVGFPTKIVKKISEAGVVIKTLKDNYILFLPLLVLIILFYLWYSRGRDPRGRQTIIPEYDVPDNLTPSQVGIIYNEQVNGHDITAEIINLAVKGFVKIKMIEKQGIFGKKDYLLEKLKDSGQLIGGYEKELLEKLFEDGYIPENPGSGTVLKCIKISELEGMFQNEISAINNKIYDSVVKGGYFQNNPEKTRRYYLFFGIAVIGISILFGNIFLNLYGVISVVVSGLLIIIFSFLMPKRTKKGVLTKEYIQGLKEYLKVAEKDRLEFHNSPEKSPVLFEKLLPYAIALKVENEWAKKFEGIDLTPPTWYEGGFGSNFSSMMFLNSLSGFNSKANSVYSSATASSGSSGFSGGFSGGGFGGGGGGSW